MAAISKSGYSPERDKPRQGPEKGGGSAAGGAMEAIRTKAHDITAGAKDTAQQWASAASDAVGHATDKAQEWTATAAHNVGTVQDDLTRLIRNYPLPAVLAGLGLGFLIGQVANAERRR